MKSESKEQLPQFKEMYNALKCMELQHNTIEKKQESQDEIWNEIRKDIFADIEPLSKIELHYLKLKFHITRK